MVSDDGFAQKKNCFSHDDGPFATYERTVSFEPASAPDAGDANLVETTQYDVTVPWFRVECFATRFAGVLARKASYRTWWFPPDDLDATQVLVLELLAATSMSAAFVNTLFTQTVNFAADDFGISDTGIGIAGSVVRAGILIALPAAIVADRLGRARRHRGRCLARPDPVAPQHGRSELRGPGGAFADSGSPNGHRPRIPGRCVFARRRCPGQPRPARVSILAMAAGFGAAVAVLSLRLADIGDNGWRYVYLIAAVWCIVALDLTRRLPETRRFAVAHIERTARPPRLNLRRLALIAAVAFIGNIFIAPASFFQNRYLADIRDFSGNMIGELFSVAVGTPASIEQVLGGRWADASGRRRPGRGHPAARHLRSDRRGIHVRRSPPLAVLAVRRDPNECGLPRARGVPERAVPHRQP